MSINFNIITPVWGQEHINFYFNYTFKSYFFDGNITELKKQNAIFTFCTYKKDIESINSHLKNYNLNKINIKFVTLDHLKNNRRFFHLAFFEGVKHEKRKHNKVNFILQTSDDIHSSNNFKNIIKLLKNNGKIRCILENKILVDKKNFIKEFHKKKFLNGITKKQMVQIGIKCMSNFTKKSFFGSKPFNYNAYSLLWRTKKNNIICRGYLLHNFLIRPFKEIKKIKSFHDYYFAEEYIKDFNNIFIIPNSSIFFRLGVDDKKNNKYLYAYNSIKYAKSLKNWTTSYHRRYAHFATIFQVKSNDKKINICLNDSLDEVNKIESYLKKYQPKSHNNHPYWKLNDKSNIFKKVNNLIVGLLSK